ncbi:MAG: response regulator transcription factor [Clostridia bacterium]|nr:response regulator transcription factor [Clostridia bacterium]MBQ2110180.1 response regulator transcription factor [Clostridia bacterium]MBQ2191479.1 response regulator transcription factor [Clostridia bacterium]MBR4635260.1 response regulator transcription factor [Clostridia bacterium]
MQILVVEDEIPLANALKKILEQQGYFVDCVHDGLSAIDYVKAVSYNLIILDVMLPKLDGFEVIRLLRKDGLNTPVLMLTARTATNDKVFALNSGADDYMTKPFDAAELVARVGALTRRRGEVMVNSIRCEDLELDLQSAMLRCGEEQVQLSRKEFEVLRTFLANPTMTIPTETLLINGWGLDSEATDNNVEVYVSFIRKKLKYLNSVISIKKIQKIGYRLEIREQ